MSKFAEGTTVPITRSRMELELLLEKHKAVRVAVGYEPDCAIVMFEMRDRRVRFEMPLPPKEQFARNKRAWKVTPLQQEQAWGQACRERWRALILTIKAKLVSVETGVESFEEAFLAHVILPGGMTVGRHIIPMVAESYSTGKMPPMLPSGQS